MADNPTAKARRARLREAMLALIDPDQPGAASDREGLTATFEMIEERIASGDNSDIDAAGMTMAIYPMLTEALNLAAMFTTTPSSARTQEIFRTLAQCLGYEYAIRLGDGVSRDSPRGALIHLAVNDFAFGMAQGFAADENRAAEIARAN